MAAWLISIKTIEFSKLISLTFQIQKCYVVAHNINSPAVNASENSVNKRIITTFGVTKLKLLISVVEKKIRTSCSIEHSVLEQQKNHSNNMLFFCVEILFIPITGKQ